MVTEQKASQPTQTELKNDMEDQNEEQLLVQKVMELDMQLKMIEEKLRLVGITKDAKPTATIKEKEEPLENEDTIIDLVYLQDTAEKLKTISAKIDAKLNKKNNQNDIKLNETNTQTDDGDIQTSSKVNNQTDSKEIQNSSESKSKVKRAAPDCKNKKNTAQSSSSCMSNKAYSDKFDRMFSINEFNTKDKCEEKNLAYKEILNYNQYILFKKPENRIDGKKMSKIYTEQDINRFIEMMTEDNLSILELSSLIGTSGSTIRRWIKKRAKKEEEGKSEKKKTYKKNYRAFQKFTLSDEGIKYIQAVVQDDPTITISMVYKSFKIRYPNSQFTKITLKNYIDRTGIVRLQNLSSLKKKLDSIRISELRQEWARDLKNSNIELEKNCIFITYDYLCSRKLIYNQVTKKNDSTLKRQNYMAAFSIKGVILVEKVNQNKCGLDIMEYDSEYLPGFVNRILKNSADINDFNPTYIFMPTSLSRIVRAKETIEAKGLNVVVLPDFTSEICPCRGFWAQLRYRLKNTNTYNTNWSLDERVVYGMCTTRFRDIKKCMTPFKERVLDWSL